MKDYKEDSMKSENEKQIDSTQLPSQRTEVTDKEEAMEKHITGENGISYTLGVDGLYYPDLMLPKGANHSIGKYGSMRADYLKEHSHSMYLELVFAGKWNEYLHEVDEECHQRIDVLVEQMKAGAGITEQLKATDQMKWVGLMNNVRNAAKEIVLEELVYL